MTAMTELTSEGKVMTRILVTGSRNWKDCEAIERRLEEVYQKYRYMSSVLIVVHGDQVTKDEETGEKYGADYIAKTWAIKQAQAGRPVWHDPHPARWKEDGYPQAGPMRNKRMVASGIDEYLAFPLGESRGTRGCMALAEAAGIPGHNYGDPE